MAYQVYLINPSINGGAAVQLKNSSVKVAWKNLVKGDPEPGSFEVTEVIKNGFENPMYTVQNIYFTGDSGTLTYPLLLAFAKNQYLGTLATRTELYVEYGDSSDLLYASDATSTSIPVEIVSFDFTINTADSRHGYMPMGNMILKETG